MCSRRSFAAIVACATLVVAVPSHADVYPAEVNAAIADARKYCEDEGGVFTSTPQAVRKLDLNGDGRDDYIVTLQEVTCDGADGGFCGTGGCITTIMVALPSGKFVTVFDQPVLTYEVLPPTRSIRFQLHGGYCGEHGGGSHCMKTHRITTKPFEYKMP